MQSTVIAGLKGLFVGGAAGLVVSISCCGIPLGLLGAIGGDPEGHLTLWQYGCGCGLSSGTVAGAIGSRRVLSILGFLVATAVGAGAALMLARLPAWGVRIHLRLHFDSAQGFDWIPCSVIGAFFGLVAAVAVMTSQRKHRRSVVPSSSEREKGAGRENGDILHTSF